MLDFADVVAINKFERRGGDDARRDVARQLVRNRDAFGASWEDMPVFGTSAATFHDEGVTALYGKLMSLLGEHGLAAGEGRLEIPDTAVSTFSGSAIPAERERYLADVAATVRDLPRRDRVHGRRGPPSFRPAPGPRGPRRPRRGRAARGARGGREGDCPREAAELIDGWEQTKEDYAGDELVVHVRDKELRTRADPRDVVGVEGQPGRAAALRRRGGGAAVPAHREPAGALPVHRRGVRVQARGRGPRPHVRRRGRRVPHQPPVPLPLGGLARRSGSRRRSTRSRSTAATPPLPRTSTARSARRACPSRRSTT